MKSPQSTKRMPPKGSAEQGAAEAAPAAERPTNAAEREKMVTAA